MILFHEILIMSYIQLCCSSITDWKKYITINDNNLVLKAKGKNLTNIKGIEVLQSLFEINLNDNHIADITY